MNAATLEPPRTLAELHARASALADIPPGRVLLHPWPGAATEADLIALANGEPKRLCELVDGFLVEKVMGARESRLGSYLNYLLTAFVRSRNLGFVTMPDGPFRVPGDRVRLPDVAFVSWDRVPGRRQSGDAVLDVPADLAVEVLSPSNTPGELRGKRDDYFAAGSRLVWEIDPDARTVAVFTRPDAPDAVLSAPAALEGGAVLPGFVVLLAELFGELDRHG